MPEHCRLTPVCTVTARPHKESRGKADVADDRARAGDLEFDSGF
jgi:hypothetical protein